MLDTAYRVPFTRLQFGLDALLGLVPGFGDVAGAVVSGYIVVQAARLGTPRAVVIRMIANIGIEALLGTVPLVGDLFDAGWKANMRNVALLRRHLESQQTHEVASRRLIVIVLSGIALLVVATLLLTIFIMRGLLAVVRA